MLHSVILQKITFLLLIKGRLDHVKRWVKYHDNLNVSINVIVGDGAPVLETEALFESTQKIRCQYLKYRDHSFSDFYKKIADMVAKCESEYCMVVEDDDFIEIDGVVEIIKFMDLNRDYSAVNGRVLDLFLKDHLEFPSAAADATPCFIAPARSFLGYRVERNSSESEITRVKNTLVNFQSYWYAVTRSDLFSSIAHCLSELNPPLLDFQERYYCAKLAEHGKTASLPVPFYIRQRGSSMGLSYKSDWLNAVISCNYGEAIDNFILAIIPAQKKYDQILFNEFKSLYLEIVKEHVGHIYLPRKYRLLSSIKSKISIISVVKFFPKVSWWVLTYFWARRMQLPQNTFGRIRIACQEDKQHGDLR